jgi:hypothetical protein
MHSLFSSPVSFAELPVEARALFSIYAMAAVARYMPEPPNRSRLAPILEAIWNRNRLCPSDISDPFRMTALLESELASVLFGGDAK